MRYSPKPAYKPRRTYKRKTYRKTAPTSRSKSLVRLIKNVSLKTQETKMSSIQNTYSMFHNVSQRFGGNLLQTTQGITDDGTVVSNRIGDTITPVGLKFLFQFRQPADRPNVNWKVWILKVKGNPSLTLYVPVKSITGNLMLDPIDTEKAVVMKVLNFKYNDNYWAGTLATSKETNFFRQCWIPLPRRPYVYSADNATAGRDYQVLMYAAAYDTTGSLITDNIGTIAVDVLHYFKDA